MSQPTRILIALIVGLLLGILSADVAPSLTARAILIADPIGGMWLDALRMTIVPLVVSLLITGIAATAEAARAGRLTLRALILFVAILWTSSLLAALLLPLFFALWPLPAASGDALRIALGSVPGRMGDVPGIGQFLRGIVPTNPVAAAANDMLLPLIFFTTLFGFAATRLPPEPRRQLTAFFSAVGDAMLVVIGWVLWIGPLGVFALAYGVGAKAGAGAVGALAHYILAVSSLGMVIWLLAYPLARFGAGIGIVAFARALAPAQAVAVSTQSSLASLPSMLAGAERLGVPIRSAGVVLPLAVALFRATGPAMNLGVALYIAYWFGIPLSPLQLAAGIAAGAITTMGAASLPGQVSFITSIAPIALAMGVPIEPLALLIAVEVLPDIIRTVGNVTMDVAVTLVAARGVEPRGEVRATDGVAP
ncbi:MAG TPA: cation:dicarboxylase symporter family transporter [Allosphingosinicella sp.]|nr:cation:dicarboxylase symporter family transporter [Allosphingosinicella sp.]